MSATLINCKTCQTRIAKAAKTCPACGAKNKSGSAWHWLGWGFGGLLLIGMLSGQEGSDSSSSSSAASYTASSSASSNNIEPSVPTAQQRLQDVVERYRSSFLKADNELQQSRLRDERREALASALSGLAAQDWVGTLSQLQTNSDGLAIVSVKLNRHVTLKTWNNSFSDLEAKTMISKNSPIYSQLASMREGQRVKVSGRFVPSKQDYISESSLTISGSMMKPEFIFRFDSIEPL